MNKPLIIDGKAYAAIVETQLAKRVAALKKERGSVPILATVIVGNNSASITYVNMKCKACGRIGLGSRKVEIAGDATTEQVLKEINKLNADNKVCGILVQHPLPRQIDEQAVFNAIDIEKDTDGLNSASFGRTVMRQQGFYCATPFAIISLLKHYGIEISGKHAVVVGRSQILGKPVAMMLLNENATVTICHTKTINLPTFVKQADIVVAAAGKPKLIQASWIKKGAVIIDAGYNSDGTGDVDLEKAAKRSSAYTPVPGGVGPVTIAKLMEQCVIAAEHFNAAQSKQQNKNSIVTKPYLQTSQKGK